MLSFFLFYSFVSPLLLVLVISQSPPALEHVYTNTSSKLPTHNIHNHIVQQDFTENPPFPILEIGLQHILAQIGANATEAGNDSMSGNAHHHIDPAEKIPTQMKDADTQCGPDNPCVDGSCCNSVRDKFLARWNYEQSLIERRKGNADSHLTTADLQLLQHASRTVMLGLCVASIRGIVRRNVR